MDGSQKRSHVATGNTPHKPADKKSREEITESSHSPARRTLGFGERASPSRKASRRLLQRARLVRSPKSPKQLPSTSRISFSWQKKEQVALVQFVALFDELKKDGSEWPTFSNRREYWNKATAFVQETTGTEFRRSCESNISYLLFIYVFIYVFIYLLYLRQHYDLAVFFQIC